MLCKCYWIVLYTVHVTAFSLGEAVFSGHSVLIIAYFPPHLKRVATLRWEMQKIKFSQSLAHLTQ